MIKQTDVPYIVRKSRGIFENVNTKELGSYLTKRTTENRKKLEVDVLKNEINNMKDDLNSIKDMLEQILEKK